MAELGGHDYFVKKTTSENWSTARLRRSVEQTPVATGRNAGVMTLANVYPPIRLPRSSPRFGVAFGFGGNGGDLRYHTGVSIDAGKARSRSARTSLPTCATCRPARGASGGGSYPWRSRRSAVRMLPALIDTSSLRGIPLGQSFFSDKTKAELRRTKNLVFTSDSPKLDVEFVVNDDKVTGLKHGAVTATRQ